MKPQEPALTPRRALLEKGAIATGERWAEGWRADLRRQGRRATGGWPGTLPEARARVSAFFLAELAKKRMLALTSDELAWATRTTYARAKHDWLARIEREDPDLS